MAKRIISCEKFIASEKFPLREKSAGRIVSDAMRIVIDFPGTVEIATGDEPETLIIRPKLVTVAKVHIKKQRGIPAPPEPAQKAVSKKPLPEAEKIKGIVMEDKGWE